MATDSTSASRDPARPSSSTSDLFGGLYARGAVAAAVDGPAWLQALLDVEAALARACAAEGLIPADAADAIAAACRAERFDLGRIAAAAADAATPVIALVRALREALPPAVAEHVHHGATSQDIVDTAAMLVARRALEPLVEDARAAADAAAGLADAHRDTVAPGRTLLQQALPMSFGLKAAGWLDGIDAALAALAGVRDDRARGPDGRAGRRPRPGGRGPRGRRSSASPIRCCRGTRSAPGPPPWPPRSARSPACSPRSRAT